MVPAGGRMVLAQLMVMNHFLVSLSSTSSEAASFESAKMSPAETSCTEGCALCSPVNGCLSCNPSFALLLRRQGPRQTASCSRICPRGFYRVSVDVYAFCRKCTIIGCVSCNSADLCTACDRGYDNASGSCVYRGEETTIDPETSTLQLLQQDLSHAVSRTFTSTPVATSTSISATSPLQIPNTLFSEPLTNPPMYETRYHSVAGIAMSQTDGVSATWGATSTPTIIANEFTDVATDASIRGGEGGGGGGRGEEVEEEEEEKEKEEEEEKIRVGDGGEVEGGEEGEEEGKRGEDGGRGGGREEVGIRGGRGSSERTTSATTSTNPNVPGVVSEETTTEANPSQSSQKTTLRFPTTPKNDSSDHSGSDDSPTTEGTPTTTLTTTTTTTTKMADANRAEKPCRRKWRLWRERYRRLFCRVAEKRRKTPRHCKHRRKMCQRLRHSRDKHKASARGQKKALGKQQATCGSLRTDAPLAATAAAALGCWGVAAALGSRWL